MSDRQFWDFVKGLIVGFFAMQGLIGAVFAGAILWRILT